MRTIAVDFDGVIHKYSRGWDDGTIYDPPVSGALGALRVLMMDHPVFIFTSRNTKQVSDWLREQGFEATTDDSRFKHDLEWDGAFWDTMGVILVTNQKLAASAYIDDRAVRFESWGQVFRDLVELGIVEKPDVDSRLSPRHGIPRTPWRLPVVHHHGLSGSGLDLPDVREPRA